MQVMAINESARLAASLKKENVPVKRLIVNQILPPSASDCKFCAMKRKVHIDICCNSSVGVCLCHNPVE